MAITGTNGKTTVTAARRQDVRGIGSIDDGRRQVSPAALDALSTALATTLPDVWVLELSSFQLATTTSLMPDTATVLNVTQDPSRLAR